MPTVSYPPATATSTGAQPADTDLTTLSTPPAAGLVESTGSAYTSRALGVGATTSIPTRADADARFLAIAGTAADSTKVANTTPGTTGLVGLAATTKAAGRAALDLDTGNSPQFTGLIVTGNQTIGGNLTVIGNVDYLTSGATDIGAAYQYLNTGYTADAATTAGEITNYSGSSVTQSCVAFVAGIDAVSNPTVQVSSTTGYTVGKFVLISGAGVDNDGFYEVLAALSTPARVQLRGVGTTACVEAFTRNQLVTGAGAGTITCVSLAVERTGTDGIKELANGSTTGLVFGDVVSLDSGGHIPVAQMGSGTPNGAKFLRDDGVFAAPTGGSVATTTATQDLAMAYFGTGGGTEVAPPTSGSRVGKVWGWTANGTMGWVAAAAAAMLVIGSYDQYILADGTLAITGTIGGP